MVSPLFLPSTVTIQLLQRKGAAGWCCFFKCKGNDAYTRSYNRLEGNIEGFRQECCISSMIYSRDTSFWSGTLDIYYSHCLPVPSSWERKSSFLLAKFSYNLSQTSLSGFNDTQKAIGRGFCLFVCLVGWSVG